MVQLDNDNWDREIWFETNGETDTYTVVQNGVTCFTVSYSVGTPMSQAYDTINSMLWSA